MFSIIDTPEPPYYAVIAPALLREDTKGYPQTAMRLVEIARGIDGFLGIESCFQGNFAIAVSYWRSLEAIEEWKRNAHHLAAKEMGRTRWFEQYTTRIARVEKVY